MTDPNRISDDQHNNAPAVPQGDPTEEMLVAGLKECEPLGELIDWREGFGRIEMRAVWEAMLAATPSPAPAQEAGLILSAEDVHAAFAKNFPKSRISQAWINFAADIAQAIAARAAKPAQEVGLTDEQKTWAVNQLMEQAQVFASAWSLVGGRHDFGNALEEAEQAKTELRSMVVEALHAKGGK